MIQTIPSKFNQFPVYYNTGGSPEPPGPDYSAMPLTLSAFNGDVSINFGGSSSVSLDKLYYSLNNGTWTKWGSTNSVTVNKDETISFSGILSSTSTSSYRSFTKYSGNGSIIAYGNASSIRNYTDTCPSYAFVSLFQAFTALVDASNLILPYKTVAEECYRNMFRGCTALTAAPQLPATGLAKGCYNAMFSGCTALSTAPDLPATTLVQECYWTMFRRCTNLNKINVSFTAWTGSYVTSDWVRDVQTNAGTFICPTALGTNATIERGNSRCPSGWTVVNK